MRLKDRVATVTGAGRGIGEQIARAFAREGAAVVVSDRDLALAEGVADGINKADGKAIALRVDVARDDDAIALAQTAQERFGKLDIHVNNAGIGTTKLFLDTTREEFETILEVNLIGAFRCAQEAVRRMLPRGYGRIINIASLSGQRGGVGRSAYGCSKRHWNC